MTKRERYSRLTLLCLLSLGILLWSSTVNAFQTPRAATNRTQKPATTTLESGALIEEFSFSLKDFKIDHQGENNNLNITISYRYKDRIRNAEYPDFTVIAKDIETLLTNYPNEDDYWEILNKKIGLIVLEKYPEIARVTSQIQVSPSPNNRYVRSSIVTRDRASVRSSRR